MDQCIFCNENLFNGQSIAVQ